MKDFMEFLNSSFWGAILKVAVFVGLMFVSLQTLSGRFDTHEKNELERTKEFVTAMKELNERTSTLEKRAALNEGVILTKLEYLSNQMEKMDARLARLENRRSGNVQ